LDGQLPFDPSGDFPEGTFVTELFAAAATLIPEVFSLFPHISRAFSELDIKAVNRGKFIEPPKDSM